MKQWSKIKGIEGLYRNANGKYYARFTKPRKTFRSLGTDKLKLARERIKELKISESSQVASALAGYAKYRHPGGAYMVHTHHLSGYHFVTVMFPI